MPKTKISEFSATPGNNTDIDGINIAEGCAPSGINDAIRELMAQLKDFQAGTAGDSFNGPVGTSTAAAGAFTTLSSTGNTTLGDASGDTVTINGATTFVNVSPTITPGTANGVAYLNGSKVLTTGSALTFDGGANLSTGGSNAATYNTFNVNNTASNGYSRLLFNIGASGANGIGSIKYAPGIFFAIGTDSDASSTPMTFNLNGSEVARLTSTGLGIGTSSPNYSLTSYKGGAVANYLQVASGATGAGSGNGLLLGVDASGNSVINAQGGGINLYTYVAGVLRTTIDSSGNLGIGTSSPVSALGFGETPSSTGITFQSTNTTFNSGKAAVIKASITGSGNGSMVFETYAGGSGGGERMRLDSAGNLGLGVTPSATTSSYLNAQVGGAILMGKASAAELYLNCNATFNSGWKYIYSATSARYEMGSGIHSWYTAASGTAGNAITFTQAMTLDASGRLGLGETSPGTLLHLKASGGPTIRLVRTSNRFDISADNDFMELNARDASTYMVFKTADTERARITSGGDLLVGGTSGDPNPGVFIYKSGAVSQGNSAGASGFEFLSFRRSGTQIGTVTQNGTTAVAYNTSSDYRLKHDIAPMTGALAKVALLKPCTYKWNADNSAGEGFIAHELAEVCPQAVTGEKDAVDADGNPKYQGIDTSFLVATLAAAIKELKAEFDAYKATHP